MKQNSLWLLFAILFLASFDMYAQMPLLSPYLHLLGASAAMIGIIVGSYSISNLAGNVTAGPFLDRYPKKRFIAVGLLLAGILLIGHGYVTEPATFFFLRLGLGFVMAFVSPACHAMIAAHGKTAEEQGGLMAKNGMVMTAAAVVAPGAGGFLAGSFGYADTFSIFGAIMLLASLLALQKLPSDQAVSSALAGKVEKRSANAKIGPLILRNEYLYLAFLSGFAVLYAQGTLVYEIPLLIQRQQLSPTVTGLLFSVKAIGSMLLFSQLWLNRISPHIRIFFGLFLLGLLMYGVAVGLPVSLYVTMLLIGVCFGLLFPAITTMLAQNAPKSLYGTLFSLFSAVLSLGAMISPLVAGFAADRHHSFFIAFFVAMGSCLLSYLQLGLFRRARV